jgi:hypothetical protein
MATPMNSPLTGDIWHLSIDDLLEPLSEAPRLGGPGPFVINLSASTAPISQPIKGIVGCPGAHVYQILRTEDRRVRYRLRLGPFASEDEAEVVLNKVRDIYPSALTATAEADDLRAIASMKAKIDALHAPAQRSMQKPADKPAEVIAEKPAQVPVEKPAQVLAEKPVEQPVEKLAEKPAAVPVDTLLQKLTARRMSVNPLIPVLTAAVTGVESNVSKSTHSGAPRAMSPPARRQIPVLSVRMPPVRLSPARTVMLPRERPSQPGSAAPNPSPGAMAAGKPPTLKPTSPAPAARAASLVIQSAPTPVAAPVAAAPAVVTAPAGPIAPAAAPAPAVAAVVIAPAAMPAMPAMVQAPLYVEQLSTHLLSLESTQTMRPLTSLELDDDEATRWFVIQLSLSEQAFDPDSLPNLDIFSVYRLYCVEGLDQGRVMHALRLGFFGEQIAAAAVASYLADFYDEPTVKRVSTAERERFADQRVEARKDIGATGRHAVIEITNERVVREHRNRAAAVPPDGSSRIFEHRSAAREGR